MQKLTKAEEQVMQVVWRLEKALLRDIREAIYAEVPEGEKKPSQSTISTILRILKDKGFVAYHEFGNTYQYYPLVAKGEYAKYYFKGFLNKYFDGSFRQLLSFFSQEGEIDLKELDQLLSQTKEFNEPEEE